MFASRVMAKTASFSIHVWEHVLHKTQELGLLAGTADVCFWSDAGPHFWANRMITARSVHVPKVFKRSLHLRFGLEHHMKEICDGYFALLDKRLEEHEAHSWLLTAGDVCRCWAQGALTPFAPKPNEEFIDVVPTASRLDFYALVPFIKTAFVPATMRGTHAWT